MSYRKALALSLLLPLVGLVLGIDASAARHALLIGVSDYARSGFDDLPGASRDLDLVSAVLRSRLGFAADKIRVLRNGVATHRGIERAFAELAKSAAPGDLVFIHYSGHGSRVRDFNDSERTSQDQTLVPFGARRDDSRGIDRFDILDDELNLWLGRISDRIGDSGQLVMVSDACHSATNTRGPSALVSRAIPAAVQTFHPMARGPATRHPLDNAIRIGAAADDERAFEFRPGGGEPVGLFTWHWVAALQQAAPSDTWRAAFERANLGVTTLMQAVQHPQITGSRADRTLFDGRLGARPEVMVTRSNGDSLTLDAGVLAGVSVGQHLTEVAHAYTSEPVRLFLWPLDDRVEPGLLKTLGQRLGDLPGFAWVERQAESDLALAVLRPRRIDSKAQFAGTPSTLPEMDPSAGLEVWVLDRGERLVHDALALPLTRDSVGIAQLAENLRRYRRQMETRRLPALGRAHTGIRTALIRVETHAGSCDGCIHIKALDRHVRRLPAGEPIEETDQGTWPRGALLSFALENSGLRDQYVYLFELAPDGSVLPVHPIDTNIPVEPLRRGQFVQLPDLDEAIVLDAPGRVSVLVIATQLPIDPFLLTQEGFERSRRATCTGNPLQCLLSDAVFGTRGTTVTGIWVAQLIDFFVDADP